ncbi:SAC3/GANP/Nin1/mts3/eIF-3 p25 family-domain-containing protein [Xylariaceae sp. FL0662B]|nr:SAC3/GANP/Nin1/mts3/eIF-3 p25 family-domain-containing protein [Xylariaceae sp. FL0662B]
MKKVLKAVLVTPAIDAIGSLSHLWHKHKHRARPRWRPFVSLSACLPRLDKPRTTSPSPVLQQTQPATPAIDQYPSPQIEGVVSPTHSPVYLTTPSPPSSTKSIKKEEATTITAASPPPPPPPLQPPQPTQPEPKPEPDPQPETASTMAERTLQQIISQLKSNPGLAYPEAASLLSKAKLSLLQLGAATPTPGSSTPAHLALAREVYEQGALFSIRAKRPVPFSRYVAQLAPFYELAVPAAAPTEQRNKVTGLYLLLLLTEGRYAEFHSELEALSVREGGSAAIESDRFLGYPVKLERWLMEGSYDRVWKSMKSREVPSEEYGVFSEILTSQIRSEIASSSERAYPSLPLSSTKSLLFLDSEGAVVEFARERGWTIRDGHIYFPSAVATAEGGGDDGVAVEGAEKEVSQMVIENALGYARELETIV